MLLCLDCLFLRCARAHAALQAMAVHTNIYINNLFQLLPSWRGSRRGVEHEVLVFSRGSTTHLLWNKDSVLTSSNHSQVCLECTRQNGVVICGTYDIKWNWYNSFIVDGIVFRTVIYVIVIWGLENSEKFSRSLQINAVFPIALYLKSF